jgi:hypothetical protein
MQQHVVALFLSLRVVYIDDVRDTQESVKVNVKRSLACVEPDRRHCVFCGDQSDLSHFPRNFDKSSLYPMI